MSAFTVVLLTLAFVSTCADDVTVESKVGTFVGFSEEININDEDGEKFKISQFLGIPYAEPPTGDLRFRRPLPKRHISEPMEVKTFGSECLQNMLLPSPVEGSEDCLFLNIYSPKLTTEKGKLPVMIWIHGGGFVIGSGNMFIPDRLAAYGQVIVVTLNYRLSVWGFLSTADSNSPGNYGLWDQHIAIKWVHDNINAFGGDSNRITIFGNSAGSASVIYQGLYKGNIGLFQRIIGQSGAPLSAWASARDPVSDANHFASMAGCKISDTAAMMTCLRGLPADIIYNTMNNLTNGLATRTSVFVPYVDHDFVEEAPVDIFKQDTQVAEVSRSSFSTYDIMAGVLSGEGYMIPPPPWNIKPNHNFYPDMTYFRDILVPQFLLDYIGQVTPALTETVVAEYVDWNDPDNPETIREKFSTLAGDVFFVEPMCRTVDTHARFSQRQSSYMYYFTASPSMHLLPVPSWADKPYHADELIYLFGGKVDVSAFGKTEKSVLEDWERKLSKIIMTLWTNFAKTGNPNKPRDLGIDWLPYTPMHRHYLNIDRTVTSRNVKTRLGDRLVHFRSKIVPAILKK